MTPLPAADSAQTALGHAFRDPGLLESALTHRSYRSEHADAAPDNQRLEFLGDAVLEILSSDLLFRRFPDAHEGELSRLRSRLTDERALAGIARRLGLGAWLLVGAGAETQGARDLDAVLADAMEALMGAVYHLLQFHIPLKLLIIKQARNLVFHFPHLLSSFNHQYIRSERTGWQYCLKKIKL